MTETNDWRGAGAISATVVILGAAFFWTTATQASQRPMVWIRLLVLRLILALLIWAIAVFSNRRKLGLRACFELGVLLLIGFGAFGLGRIFGDVSVESTVSVLNLGGLSNAMFLSGACITTIALSILLRLLRLQAIMQRFRGTRDNE
jgi:hypothetical protein